MMEQRPSHASRSGFTLIELAVVLVIIGFIMGGIVVANTMVRHADLRAVMTDIGKFSEAIKQFQDKYGSLPGDMANATSYWAASGTCPIPYTTTPGTATCNGDGDGRIFPISAANYYEMYVFWQHLTNAAMIEGAFTGATGSGAGELIAPGVNVPLRMGSGYTVLYARGADTVFPSDFFPANYQHVILFGRQSDTTKKFSVGATITASETLGVDTKLDDGKPGTGKLLSFQNGSTLSPGGCATTNSATTAAYNTSASGQICALIFMMAF